MARKSRKAVKTAKKTIHNQAARPAIRRRIAETLIFRRGKQGRIFRIDLRTRALGKIITAAVGGRVKAIAISR